MTDTLDADPAAGVAPASTDVARSRGDWWWSGLRPLVLRLHFFVGIFVGPFLLVAATTGLLYTITPQLESLVHHDALTVPAVGTAQVPLREQVVAAAAAVPDGTVTEIRPPRSPDGTTRVTFDAPGVEEEYSRTAFVDPYTGQVRAVLDTYGEWLPVRAWVDELHRTLHLGPVGRLYSEVAASWLGVLALSGGALWTARRRRRARVRRTLLPQGSATGRVRLRSWHGAVGLWAAVGMLFLSATGLTWSQFAGANVTALRASLDWSTPTVATALPAQGAPSDSADPEVLGATADRVLAAARAAAVSDQVALLPGGDGEAWVVGQVQRSWPEKQDSVAVDPTSATVVDTLRFADWPLAAKLARWGVDAHMGLLFGVANQVALAALALAVLCLVVWGYRMWWLRRPTRGGRAGPPGGDLRPGPGAVLLVGAVAVVAGVFLPVLGVTLLLFLLADIGRQQLRARRSASR
ncbi:PepSY domain-containing protein [Pseudonocardia sp. MH-G8]|uniref:PepSY-associated TM helix domain-containing protein n=1 Tax=Pseudonocardia sp. MH-G8 TaxID=1854588 RepID=UPI000BA024CD|nr:PepSY-associated TM helix domain-containing protein [Pseudonocardia sp. MH-G8]OZM79532.1 peptidase [Pseudonocardia sp. MH-G8]